MIALPRGRKQWVFVGLTAGAVLGLLVFGYALYLWLTLTMPRAGDRSAVLIYGSSLLLEPGLHVQEARLKERLDHLGYDQISLPVQRSGEYRMNEASIDLYLHDVPDAHFKGYPVRLELEKGRVVTMLSLLDSEEVLPVSLEPPLISGVRGQSRQIREWIPLESMPHHVIQAVLAIEDHRFYQHVGIDPVAVARALWVNLRSGRIVQGGSTITQQLAKNLYYSSRRTVWRKFKEAMAAIVLELKYEKDELLETYLNEIYLGQAGSVGIYGMSEAAQRYFRKPIQDVTLSDSALLAGLIKAPNTYSPWKDESLAIQRRDLVLRRLYEGYIISEEQLHEAVETPLGVAPAEDRPSDAPYFVDYLLTEAEGLTGALQAGSKILATVDPITQRIADTTLQDGLRALERTYPALTKTSEPVQGALVALDPRTGAIIAMTGGREYRTSQFNRAVQAHRQPGSLFKTIVYLAAFESRKTVEGEPVTPTMLVSDTPITFSDGQGAWTPQNYDHQFRGEVTIRTAVEQSLNIPAVRVAQWVGVDRLVQISRELGMSGPIKENLSIALGTAEVSLLEITAAFGVLANGGIFVAPTPIRGAVASTGETLWFGLPERRRAVSPEAAYLMTSLLQGVIDRGTGARARVMGLQGNVAGKTGTTDGYRDAWFVGYTSELVIGVWVGFDDGSDLGLTGAQAALPIWTDFARQVIRSGSPEFEMPPGVLMREVDPESGQLATSRCPVAVKEFFMSGTQPTAYCEIHGLGWWDRVKQGLGL